MKPAWDELMETYKDNDSILVADVDCTTEGKPLCSANGVRGYPTILWGDPSDLQKYQGGRDAAALKKFAEANLKPICSPFNLDLCDDQSKAAIEELQALSDADLKVVMKAKDDALVQAKKDYDELESSLKSQRGLMKAVQAHKKATAGGKDEL